MADSVRLLARADDIGSFHSANRAILEAYRDGIVRNTSVLAVGHCFDEAVEMVKGEPGLCLGLHSTITAEWENARWAPVLPADEVPALVDGQGHLVRQAGDADDQGATVEQILAEVMAQLDKARDAGLNIEYLDTHMGFSWIDGVSDALAELCARKGLVYANGCGGLQRLPKSDAECPVVAVAEGIAKLRAGDAILVTHPAYDDEEMREVHLAGQAPGEIAAERELDRRMFTDARVLEAVRDQGVELIRYTEV